MAPYTMEPKKRKFKKITHAPIPCKIFFWIVWILIFCLHNKDIKLREKLDTTIVKSRILTHGNKPTTLATADKIKNGLNALIIITIRKVGDVVLIQIIFSTLNTTPEKDNAYIAKSSRFKF
jgi:hypothetical protein